MRLLSLTLESFRSYPALTISFDPKENITVLLGENATGKTNILEAVAILAHLKSPRHSEDADLITWEKTHYRVTGVCRSDNGEELKLEVVSVKEPRKQRVCFINGVRTPASRSIGTLPLITFMPDDLSLFTGPPSARRRLIDQLLCQVSPSHVQALSEYEKVMKQRNSLLRNIRDGLAQPQGLPVWDEKLATFGALITIDRLQLFETLQLTILRELRSLGESPRSALFHYVRKTTAVEESALRNELIEQLRHYRQRDLLTLTTTVGPHRDDWTLAIDGRDIVTFASRGQQRAAVLALLLLQASFLELRKNEKPVLLLDDVFSEFDEKHRKAVLRTLTENQVIITAVELENQLREQALVLTCPIN